jgi:hypothetical protein
MCRGEEDKLKGQHKRKKHIKWAIKLYVETESRNREQHTTDISGVSSKAFSVAACVAASPETSMV